jgi:hypothetical protein
VRVDPLRMMRGAVTTAAPTNNAAVALYNSSPAPHVLNVLAINSFLNGNNAAQMWTMRGRLTNQNVGTIVTVVSDEAPGPGLIDSDDLGSFPPPDSFGPDVGFVNLGLEARYPFAVLKPGWSLVVGALVGGTVFGCGFIWEWCLAEDFYRRNPDIVLEEILASLKG